MLSILHVHDLGMCCAQLMRTVDIGSRCYKSYVRTERRFELLDCSLSLPFPVVLQSMLSSSSDSATSHLCWLTLSWSSPTSLCSVDSVASRSPSEQVFHPQLK